MPNDIEAWYKDLYNMVFRQCRSILKNNEEAEDAAHDVFERLLKAEDRLHVDHPEGLLSIMSKRISFDRERKNMRDVCRFYTMATHVSLKRIREKNMTAKALWVFLKTNVSPALCDGEKVYCTTEEGYDQTEAELLVQAILDDESEETSTICYMRYFSEMNLTDIGKAVGLSKSAVEKRLLKFGKQARLKLGGDKE